MSKVRLVTALVAAAATVAACSGPSQSQSQSAQLRLWHYEAPTSAMGQAWDEAIKEFQAAHPGVTIKFETKGFEQIQKTAPMVLNSNDAPDIMEYNKGNATAGLLSKQGLLTDLSSQASRRGWDKLLSSSLQTTARYDSRGIMGSGKWYGVPNYAEYVMVYYNKDLFAKHGVPVPSTFDEFTSAMDKFVGAGVTPLSVGGAEYPAQQILYELALSRANRGWVDSFQRYTGKMDFHDAAWTYAATTFADWVRKGYISKTSASIKAEEMGTAFEKGTYPIVVTGSWWYGRFESEIKDFQWGSLLWPGNKMNPGSSGNLWVVPSGSKHKDLAYDFIDLTMKRAIQDRLGNAGGIPVAADTSSISDPKNKELTANFNTLAKNDGLAFYPDWPAPGYYDVLVSGVQELINGSKSPSQVLDEIAKPYNDNLPNIR
jgi:raffinose/stachyose/melibiose transport system substrate-binding protein